MMRPTRNQWIFATIFAGYTVLFHHFLSSTIEAQQYERIWMFATGYGVLTFFTALVIGAFDPIRRSRGVLAFQYNLTVYVVSVVIWLVWNGVGLAAEEEMSRTYLLGMGFWGLGVLVHYLSSKSTVKGIPKREMFE